MRKVLLTLTMCFALIASAFAQQTVTGTVTDEDGAGIPGVTVIEKGTSNGTVTNVDGDYTIEVASDNAVLNFSFVGLTTVEETVNGRSEVNVTLTEDAIGIDEVVVTALGIKRETKKLGYSMTEVEGQEIANLNTVNPVDALQGKSAGLSIGSSDGGLFGHNKIQLRGVSVLNSSDNQPIFVIDGVIIESGIANASADWAGDANDFGSVLKNLNPDDYESLSVLKGAAATALYGSRGINGAIVIQTKDGQGQRGIGVDVTQSFGVDYVYAVPDLQYEFGAGTLAGYIGYGDKDENGDYYRWDTDQIYKRDVDGQNMASKIGANSLSWGPRFDGRPIEDFDGEIREYVGYPDQVLDAYDLGTSSNTSVAFSGANEKGSFYLSNSYNLRKGVMPTNEFERNATMVKGTYNLASWLTADASVSFTTSRSKNPSNTLGSSFSVGSWRNWYDTERWKKREVWQAPHGGVPQSAYGDDYANVPGNGVWFGYHLNDATRKEQVTRPIVRLTADITNWLSLTAEGNMNHYSRLNDTKNLGSGYAMEGGSYRLRNQVDVTRTGKLTANIDKTFGDISTSLILGGEIWDQEKQFTESWTEGGLIVPGKFFIGNSKETKQTDANVFGTKQINSLYFMANFGWKDQVYLDVTGRNDWSSALVYSDGTGNYSYFYPSVSTSWIFSETIDLPAAFSFGKLRASWAQVGNDTSPYLINRGYEIENTELADNKFVYRNTKSTTLVDPSIKPELKNSLEVGLDVRFFNNRLSADIAYYDESITNQIGTIPIPSATGYNEMLTNIGTLTNTGFELSFRFVPVQTANFEWESTFNYWDNTTTISDLREEVGEYKALGGSVNYGNYRVGSVAFEGGEYGVLMSDTKPLEDENGNKILTWSDDRRGAYYTRSYEVEEVGKINPDFEGSWDNAFSYKNLRLSVLLNARFGGHIASYNNKYGHAYGYMESSLEGRDADHGGLTWTSEYANTAGRSYDDGIIPDGVFAEEQKVTTPSGDRVDVGGMTYQEAYDAGYVEPTHASFYHYFNSSWGTGVINDNWFNEVKYIALRNISIGYNLPKSLAQRIKAQNLYLSLNARNVGYLYNSLPNNLNPESFRGTSSDASYYERSFTPYTANYTMTLSIDF
ncbi:MAG: SusC/RagA family TonB-linked outer membrane protein [Tangfeifania sp.]